MNKKVIITIIVAILIIGLAIFVGVKLSNKNTKNTKNTKDNLTTTNVSIPSIVETPLPIDETSTPEPIVIPSTTPTPTTALNENITNYSVSQKEDYAKKVAKEFWEKTGNQKQVYYNVDNVESAGKYIVSVREKASTSVLLWYEVDVNNKTCKVIN